TSSSIRVKPLRRFLAILRAILPPGKKKGTIAVIGGVTVLGQDEFWKNNSPFEWCERIMTPRVVIQQAKYEETMWRK
ncbi:MAG: hypothetical protein ACO3F3_13265, partial [Gemmataceae bacterium]